MVVFINAERGVSVSPELPADYKEIPAGSKVLFTEQSVPILSSEPYNSTVVTSGSEKVTVSVNVGAKDDQDLIRKVNEQISGESQSTMVNTSSPLK